MEDPAEAYCSFVKVIVSIKTSLPIIPVTAAFMVLWSLLNVATHEVTLAPLIEIVVTLKLYVLSLLLQVPDIVDSVPPPLPEPLQVSSPLTVIV